MDNTLYLQTQTILQAMSIIVAIVVAVKNKGKDKILIGILCFLMILTICTTFTFLFNNNNKEIEWKDKAFEKMMQKALNKDGKTITPKELENITTLYIIGNKIAYKDKAQDEVNFSKHINDKTVYYKFKLREEENLRSYYEKGDIIYLDDIKYFKELKELYIVLNKIEDMYPLKDCTKLKYLCLDSNEIKNICIPDSFKDLEYLSLADNKINDISPLQSEVLANLSKIILWSNEITDISDLEKLINREKITILNLNFNAISEISNFNEYKSLLTLNLKGNYIDNIENLSNLSTLTYLDLSDNKIDNINTISNLASLKTLYLTKNNISNIDSIKNLDLGTLSLYQNRLNIFPEDFKNKNCSLDIRDNYIKNKSSLKDFKNLKSDFSLFNIDFIKDKEKNPETLIIKMDTLHEVEGVTCQWDTSNPVNITNAFFEGEARIKLSSYPGNHKVYIEVTDKFGNHSNEIGETSNSSNNEGDRIEFSYTIE